MRSITASANRPVGARARALAARLWRGAVRRPVGRVLHGARRRAALRRIAALRDSVESILVVCQGNICRSPYAALALSRSLREGFPRNVEVLSVGFLEPGHPAPPAAVTVGARRGVDLSRHRSQRIDAERVRRADLVVVMDAEQERRVRSLGQPRGTIVILADLLPEFGEARVIPDPIDQPPETFARVYAQIDQCVEALRETLGSSGG